MGSKLLRPSEKLAVGLEQFEVYDHFLYFIDADLWTISEVTTGTVTHEGAGRSRIKLFNTAAADAAVLATTNELFKITANKAMKALGLINGSDVDTDDGMVAFGWADALAATTLADTTGAVTATDAILLHKLPDTTVWALHTEVNGLANKAGDGSSGAPAASTVSTTSALTGSAQQLEIDVTPRSSTVFEVRAKVDGELLKDSSGKVIMHAVALGTATDMDFGVMTKSNDAADFSVFFDLLYAAQAI